MNILRCLCLILSIVGLASSSSQALAQSTSETSTDATSLSESKTLRVLTKRIEPFVAFENDTYSGFSIDLWKLIAQERNWKFEFELSPTLTSLLEGMENGRADVAIAAVSITAERETVVDFSHPFFRSGLQILVPGQSGNTGSQIWSAVRDLFTSTAFAYAAAIFLVSVLIVSHVTWLLERKNNPQFSSGYLPGLWDAFWWAIVTITTVGYGDKAPKAFTGRLFALFWMIFGYFMFAYFTASVTSTVTVQELRGTIRGPEDLLGRKVAVIAKSTSSAYLERQGNFAGVVPVDRIEQAYALLEKGDVDFIEVP